jgi:putative AdoMet-dependent methyltransferase
MNFCAGWQYDEMQPVGTDFTDNAQVQAYDLRMQKLRDVKRETENIIKTIKLGKNQEILEFGTGTGSFAIEAAKHCTKVFAVDISPVMLEFTRQKAKIEGIDNIEFHNAGFLTYVHRGEPLDAVVSQLALHHLPDFWKMIALKRIYQMLKNGGTFFLGDAVFSFPIEEYDHKIDNWIDTTKQRAGINFAEEAGIHIKEEYSTFDWIMEGLLKRAGFQIDKAEYFEGFMAVYVCTKEKS